MSENSIKNLSVDEILAGIKAEVKRKKRNFGTTEQAHGDSRFVKPDQKQAFIIKDHYHLSEFLSFHDEAFVINAYQGVLKRYPDENGFRNFLNLLRSGRLSKVEMIGKFRFSPEGRQYSVKIRGLVGPLVGALFFRIPLIGRFLRIFYEMTLLTGRFRDFERLEYEFRRFKASFFLEKTTIENRIMGLDQDLNGQMDLLDQDLNARILSQEHHFKQQLGELKEGVRYLDQNKADLRKTETTLDRFFGERERLLSQQRDFIRLLDEVRASLPGPLTKAEEERFSDQEFHLFDGLYVAFQDQFRGTRHDIKKIQKVYLPILREVVRRNPDLPVVDVGCGRGEWLEVLKGEAIKAIGVDMNRIMIRQCLESGLEVHERDAILFLRELPAGTLAAITGFHLIEHIPFESLIALMDESIKALMPGGALIFETPNPGNIMVGSCNFYFDPTHRNPLPSQLVKFLLEERGFVNVSVYGILNPKNGAPTLKPLCYDLNNFNEIVLEPHDYAVIGYKTG